MNGRKTKNLALMMLLAGLALIGCSRKDDDVSKKTVENKTTEDTSVSETTENDTTHITKETTETVTEETTEETTEKATEAPSEKETTNSGGSNFTDMPAIEFNNSAFLGDSRTAGLEEKGVVKGADFYTSIGVSVKDVVGKKNFVLQNGTKGTMLEAVSQKEYDRIYLMFGINELGWPYKESFVNYYTTIINTLKGRFPNSKIYVQSILPMVEKRTDEIYNNDKIKLFNTYIEEVAANTGVNYIEVGVSVADETGALPENASNDGIHLNKEFCFKWAKYLKEKTIK